MQLHNPSFKPIEFDRFRNQVGLNRFSLSPKKWIEATAAMGLYARSGRGRGTYAHRDIAFEFASWLSPEASGSWPGTGDYEPPPRNPIRLLVFTGGSINSRIASNTTRN